MITEEQNAIRMQIKDNAGMTHVIPAYISVIQSSKKNAYNAAACFKALVLTQA